MIFTVAALLLAMAVIAPAASGGGAAGDCLAVVLPGGADLELVRIPAGTFVQGSPKTEPGHRRNEGPTRAVTVSRAFYLARTELTQAQWESVAGTRPWSGDDHVHEAPDSPAVCISWDDIQLFLARLNANAAERERYRLPTECEWEYACRAGTTTPWSTGVSEGRLRASAWYRANLSVPYAHAVGLKAPNPWGLYDMHGNVWEWVEDVLVPYGTRRDVSTGAGDRVNRGGSFYDPARKLRAAYRNHDAPDYRSADTGLRLAREIP